MSNPEIASPLPDELRNPPREFSLLPFWFWNDELSEVEILRQIADFEAHGVYGFVIHPRVGLPRNIGWMSEAMLHFMAIAIEEAARRDMTVILYDEGMYPSGSSCGQVVASDPSLACRCLARLADGAVMPIGANLVAEFPQANGGTMRVIDRPADSVIRGLHYINEATGEEDLPPAGDVLNPRTVETVLRLVYDKFFERFGKHFGKTIIGMFTDEPSALGRLREKGVVAGTTGILQHVNTLLGYDFTPHLPSLWSDDAPDAGFQRANYKWAIHRRLEETWFRPLSEWCVAHGVALCGHPDAGDEIGVQRLFQIPGQDLVWRWVLPDHPTALEGPESTQGKCSSSAMLHYGRRRNSNEFCGAYGSETTVEEFKWLANWCFIRGVNLLIPHAFYYSVRGPRRDERPPQVGGVGCAWWDEFKPFADHCRTLSWLNTDSKPVYDIAILANPDHCPWLAAKVCFEHQRDFAYLDISQLSEATVNDERVSIAGMNYQAIIIDGDLPLSEADQKKLAPLVRAKRVIHYRGNGIGRGMVAAQLPEELIRVLDQVVKLDVSTETTSTSLRVRHVVKGEHNFYLFFNEGSEPLSVTISGKGWRRSIHIELNRYQMTLYHLCGNDAVKYL